MDIPLLDNSSCSCKHDITSENVSFDDYFNSNHDTVRITNCNIGNIRCKDEKCYFKPVSKK